MSYVRDKSLRIYSAARLAVLARMRRDDFAGLDLETQADEASTAALLAASEFVAQLPGLAQVERDRLRRIRDERVRSAVERGDRVAVVARRHRITARHVRRIVLQGKSC